MEVAVLICGVADPKWPLPQAITLDALHAHASRYAALSPFDEAALELALKLRDRDASVRVCALVAGDDALARRVAGWRPDSVHRVDLEGVPRWDAAAVAHALAQALDALAREAPLVLIGREFGDWDDGTVPAALAQAAGRPCVALALAIDHRADAAWVLRQGSASLERLRLPGRALLSATNDPGNRLRHPLMKNVMLAKKAAIPAWRAEAAADALLSLQAVEPAAAPVRRAACEWLEGSTQDKAQALADLLRAAAKA